MDFKIMKEFSDKRQKAHIESVCSNINDVIELYPEYKRELFLRKLNHDISKTKEPEYTPYIYINWVYKCKRDGVDYQLPEGMAEKTHVATIHHVLTNRHHPEFHAGKTGISITDRDKSDNPIDASKMKDVDIIEMVCDWQAVATERGANTARDWFNRCSGTRWLFTRKQKNFIDELLTIWEGY